MGTSTSIVTTAQDRVASAKTIEAVIDAVFSADKINLDATEAGKAHIDPRHQDHAGQWEIVDYEERKRPQEYVDQTGENRVRFVGDWDNPEVSHGSGRKIVNIYHLKHKKTGDVKPFGADTAYLAMGLRDRDVAQRKAEKMLQEKRNAEQLTADIAARADKHAKPTKRDAYTALYDRNPHIDPWRLAEEGIALTKDGKWYVVIDPSAAKRLESIGWSSGSDASANDGATNYGSVGSAPTF